MKRILAIAVALAFGTGAALAQTKDAPKATPATPATSAKGDAPKATPATPAKPNAQGKKEMKKGAGKKHAGKAKGKDKK